MSIAADGVHFSFRLVRITKAADDRLRRELKTMRGFFSFFAFFMACKVNERKRNYKNYFK
jgi:hypothetical protein